MTDLFNPMPTWCGTDDYPAPYVDDELAYEPWAVSEDEDDELEIVYRYRPVDGRMTVDGITYYDDNAFCQRAMLTVKYESYSDAAAVMRCSRPPTDAELDAWVKTRSIIV